MLHLLGFLLASLDFNLLRFACFTCLVCLVWLLVLLWFAFAFFSLICLALLALPVFTSLTCFSWLSYSILDLVAKLARALVLDFDQLLSFFCQISMIFLKKQRFPAFGWLNSFAWLS